MPAAIKTNDTSNPTVDDRSTSEFNIKEVLADDAIASGEFKEARKILIELSGQTEGDCLAKARVLRKLAQSYLKQWSFIDAFPLIQQALINQEENPDNSAKWWEEWIELENEYIFALFAKNDHVLLQEVLQRVKPYIEDKGNVQQQINFYYLSCLEILHRHRFFKLPNECFDFCRVIIQLAKKEEDRKQEIWGWCILGFSHLWQDDFEKSRACCFTALELLKSFNYDEGKAAACSTIAYSYCRQHNVVEAESWARVCLDHALSTCNTTYEGLSKAHLSWVKYKKGHLKEAEELALASFKVTSRFMPQFPHMTHFILMAVCFEKNEIEKAAQYAFVLLHPHVKQLPDSLTQLLQRVISSWGKNDLRKTKELVRKTLLEAEQNNYI